MAGERDQREMVGNLSASDGHNPDRESGNESTQGVSKALQTFAGANQTDSTQEPYPSMLAAGASVRGLPQLMCPLDGCDYTHNSSQGLAGHVGNAAGHSWKDAGMSSADLHEIASRGQHPNLPAGTLLDGPTEARRETTAATHVERVRQWCDDSIPLDLPAVQVYVHPARKRVEIQSRDRLSNDEFEAYRVAMMDSSVVGYDGRDHVNYVSPNRVADLPGGDRG